MEKEKQGEADLAREKERMDNLNLAALQRLDDKIVKVLGNAGHVALYSFDADKQEWERKEVEGSLFVAARSIPPHQQVVVLNRLNTENFIEPITSDLEMEIIQPYLLFRNKTGEITGVWFYKKAEQTKISDVIQGLLKKIAEKQVRPKSGNGSPLPARHNDNVNYQKDNRDPEQNINLRDNQGQQRRSSGSKKIPEREETTSPIALHASQDKANGSTQQTGRSQTLSPHQLQSQTQFQPQEPQQAQPQPQLLLQQHPQLKAQMMPQQFHSPQQLYQYPVVPFLPPSQQHGHYPYYPPHYPGPQFPAPLQHLLHQPAHHPQRPPGLSPSPQHRDAAQSLPEIFVQQLPRPTNDNNTRPSNQKPPITKEGIREVLSNLVQDDTFISMVHAAYMQQIQKGDT